MLIKITQIQPTTHPHQQINYHTSTISLHNNLQSIIIGRNPQQKQQIQSNHQNNKHNKQTVYLNINNKSISRKHVKISISPSLKRLVDKNINININQINKYLYQLPSYYKKLANKWKLLSKQLLTKIRQYSQPTLSLLITDLNSKYGIYKQIQTIKIVHHNADYYYQNVVKSQNLKDKLQVIKWRENCKLNIQLGNQTIVIQQIRRFKSIQELVCYKNQAFADKQNKIIQINAQQHPTLTQSNIKQSYYTLKLKQQNPNPDSIITPTYIIISDNQNKNKITIGRNSSCDIQISKSSISRKQCYVSVDQFGNWVLQDINSTNGLWVGCQKILYDCKKFMKQFGNIKSNKTRSILQNSINQQSSIQGISILNNLKHQTKQIKLKPIAIKLGQVKFQVSLLYANDINHNQSEIWNGNNNKNSEEKGNKSDVKFLQGLSIQEMDINSV